MDSYGWLDNLWANRRPGFPLEIQIISSINEWENMEPRIRKSVECFPVVGLDSEWVSCRRGHVSESSEIAESSNSSQNHYETKVSLVQIATVEGLVLLVRIFLLEPIPKSLRELFELSTLRKVGVEISEDARRLRKDYNLELFSGMDVRFLQREVLTELARRRDLIDATLFVS